MGGSGRSYHGNQPLDTGSDGTIDNNILTVTGLVGVPLPTGYPQAGQTIVYNSITNTFEWGWPTMANTTNTGALFGTGDPHNIPATLLFVVAGVGLTRVIVSGTITAGFIVVSDPTENKLALFDDIGRPVDNPISKPGVFKLDASGLNEFDFVPSPDFNGTVSIVAISSPVSSSIPLAPTETAGSDA